MRVDPIVDPWKKNREIMKLKLEIHYIRPSRLAKKTIFRFQSNP